MCPMWPYHKAVIHGVAITVSHMPLDELKQAPGTPALLSDPSVMIVEDDHDVANTIRRFIERVGMKTCWARNGSEAVRLKESFQPEIVLVDLELPDVSGVSLISWLAGQRDCGIIVVSGRGDEVERGVGIEVGPGPVPCIAVPPAPPPPLSIPRQAAGRWRWARCVWTRRAARRCARMRTA